MRARVRCHIAIVRILALVLQVVILGFILWDFVVSLWGWQRPTKAIPSRRTRQFRVVVPAHNEGGVIGGVLGDAAGQDYPGDLVRIAVIADRCSDDTVEVAAPMAEVAERNDGPEGKGAAVSWYLAQYPLDSDEALVVVDADSRLPEEMLARIADEMAVGADALQAYLDVENPDASLLTTASALSYWAGNRMVQLARANLGWSCDLGGTGMAFSPTAIELLDGFGATLAEDKEATVQLALSDVRVGWLHDVRIRDPKPVGLGVAVRQRARWVAGKRSVVRSHVPQLVSASVRRGSLALFDLALRLMNPGRSFLAMSAAVLAVLAAATGWDGFLWWGTWAIVAAVAFFSPVAFLARDHVPGRYLVRYPLLALLAVLWVPIRVASRIGNGWYHTPRSGADGDGGATTGS
jgi:cellulose synthase/poly-beta-1,6-N-acetylglucosamine synthase-like glycosyltransferase